MTNANIRVRPAVDGDHEALVKLLDYLAADEHGRNPSQFRDRTMGITRALLATLLGNNDEIHLMAELGSGPAGYAFAQSRRQGGGDGISLVWPRPIVHLQIIVVSPEHRRQGLGCALFAAAESWAKCLDAEYIGLNLSSGNRQAKAFYAAMGYAPMTEYLAKTLRPVQRLEASSARLTVAAG